MKNFYKQIPSVIIFGIAPTFVLYYRYGSSKEFFSQVNGLILNGPVGWYFAYLFAFFILVIVFNCFFVDLKYNSLGKIAAWIKDDVLPFYKGIFQSASGIILTLSILMLKIEGVSIYNIFWAIIYIIISVCFLIVSNFLYQFNRKID